MSVFLACAVFGGALLILQLVLGFVGADDAPVTEAAEHDGSALGGLELLTVRSLAAGTAFFGVAGGAARAAALPTPLAVTVGVAVGLLAAVAVAWVLRAMRRVGGASALHVEEAIGLPATVYIPIPADRAGAGKVHVTLRGRTVEYQALTAGPPLRTGDLAEVVDVAASDTVIVARPLTLIPE